MNSSPSDGLTPRVITTYVKRWMRIYMPHKELVKTAKDFDNVLQYHIHISATQALPRVIFGNHYSLLLLSRGIQYYSKDQTAQLLKAKMAASVMASVSLKPSPFTVEKSAVRGLPSLARTSSFKVQASGKKIKTDKPYGIICTICTMSSIFPTICSNFTT